MKTTIECTSFKILWPRGNFIVQTHMEDEIFILNWMKNMLFMFLPYTSIHYDGTYYVFQIVRTTI